MWKRVLGAVAALLSIALALLTLLLVRPNDLVEFAAGIILGGSVPRLQFLVGIAAAGLWAFAVWSDRAPPPAIRMARHAPLVLLAIAMIATTWNEQGRYLRSTTQFLADGTPRVATVYRPRGTADELRPAVVIVHGSGDTPRRGYHFLARRFAERGFVVLNADKRGVGDSPGKYYGDGLGNEDVIAVRAIETRAALDQVAGLPEVDRGRIGLVTISQGGWVMSSLLDGSSPARFAINISGPAVSTSEESAWSDWTEEDKDHFGMKPPPIPFEELDRRIKSVKPGGHDPRANLRGMTMPSLWLFGEWDSSLPARASIGVLDSLIETGRPVTWRMFPEANHGLFVVRGPNGSRMAKFAPGVWDTVFAWTARERITR